MALLCLCLSIFITACSNERKAPPAPVFDYGGSGGAGSAGVHSVASGDTAYNIAKRYDVPLRDLLDKNKLYPPYNLNVGQRLLLPPPDLYHVKSGDSLYGIARIFDVNVHEMARRNHLSSPYVIHPGDVLKLPYRQRDNGDNDQTTIAQSHASNNAAAPKPSGSKPNDSKPTTASSPSKSSQALPKPKPQLPKSYRAPARSSSKFDWPLRGRVISNFGPKQGGLYNEGINIAASKGAPVSAAENGVVLYTGQAIKGYGNLILVKHDGGWISAYGHLDKIIVKKGQQVKIGQKIGAVGTTGQVTTPQLHFEIRKGSTPMDPRKWLS